MPNRTPRGGTMGIPKCGGIHGIEPCFLCRQLTLAEKQLEQTKRYADLLEEQLELEYKGYRRPRYQAPPEPKTEPTKPQLERRGL